MLYADLSVERILKMHDESQLLASRPDGFITDPEGLELASRVGKAQTFFRDYGDDVIRVLIAEIRKAMR